MRALLTVTLATLALALVPAVASAADLYVETAGVDTPGCGATNLPASSACATIAYATSAAASGDTVKVGAGTFFTPALDGIQLNKSLTIDGEGQGVTYISGNNSVTYNNYGTIRFSGTGFSQTVRDFSLINLGRRGTGTPIYYAFFLATSAPPAAGLNVTIENVDVAGPGIGVSSTGLETSTNPGSLTIRNLETSEIYGQQLLLQRQLGAVVVEDSEFNVGASTTSTAIIDANYVLGGGWPATAAHVFRNNTFNARQGIQVRTGFFTPYPGSPFADVTIEGNTFVDPGSGGASAAINIQNDSTTADGSDGLFGDLTISDNVITDQPVGIVLTGRMLDPEVTGNEIRSSSIGVRIRKSIRTGALNSNIPVDPIVSANQIVDNATAGVQIDATQSIPAVLDGNWWGCNEGPAVDPAPLPDVDCDSVTTTDESGLTLDNWVVLRVAASPSPKLFATGTANITAGFDQLNTAAPAAPVFDDGTVLPMAATGGTLSSNNPTLTSSVATPTFTSSATSGRSATASFDHESVTHSWDDAPVVTITAPANGLITNQSSVTLNYTVTPSTGVTCNLADGASVSLSPGANTIVVLCTDTAGNADYDSVAVIYDNVDPTVSIISPDDGLITSAASVIVNFTANDAYGIDSCDKTDGFSAPLVEGPNTITVTCTDNAGNTGSDSITVTRDTIAPVVTISSPADGLITNVQTHTLAYSYIDATATNCTPANGSTVTLSPGSNSVTVTCTDEAGNVGSATNTVTYDTTPPSVDITSPNDGLLTNQNSVSVSYTSSDVNGIASCTPPASPFTANLVEGANTISVTCTDNAGNIGSDSITVTRNTTPPTVNITAPNDGLLTNQSSVSVSYTSNDDVGIASCTPPASPFTANLVEGANTITVTCTDNAGNIGSDSITVTRNTTPPTVNITAPNDGLVTQAGSVQVSYTASDDVGIDSCTPATSPFTATLSEGPNTISVSCTDNAGNTGDDQITVTRDTISPDVEITSPTNGLITNASSVDVEFEVDDATATTCNRNDGDAFALSAGVNTITVICTDAAGNIGYDSISVIRDNTAPTVTIVSPIDGLETNASSVIVNFTVLDAYGIDSCTENDGFSAPLNEGANLISVSCTDKAGNVGNSSITVTRDSTPPAVTITAPTNGSSTTDATTTLSYSVSDAHPTNCTPADGSQVSLNYGANVITVSCTDSFGNSGSAQTTVTRTSSEPPVVTITSPANGAIINAAQTTLTYNAASAHGTVSCTPASGASVPLAIGANELTVSCTDSFGNTTSASVTVFRPDSLPACAKDVSITEVTRVGSRTRIRGVARLQFAGQKVKLQYKPTGSKTAGTATVRVDGSFTAVVSRPSNPSYKSDNARYRALLGSTSTAWIKITRRMGASAVTYDGNGRLVISGSVSKPLIRGQRLRVQRSDACGAYRQIGTLTIKSDGTFKGSVASGGGSQGAAFIRLAATVGNSGNPKRRTNTYSIVQPVVIER